MDNSVITALSAVLGSAVGGAASIATAWVTHRAQGHRTAIQTEIERREKLYTEFITVCSKLALDSLDHSLESPETLIQIYSLENRIRLTSSQEVIDTAGHAMRAIIEQYLKPSITMMELIELRRSGGTDDHPLGPFSEACRRELKELKNMI